MNHTKKNSHTTYKDAVIRTPSNQTHTSNNPKENAKREVGKKEASVNSMDVSPSTTSTENIFNSPPQVLNTTKPQQQPKTQAQKRRQRRYNLRNLKRNKDKINLEQTRALPDKQIQLPKTPICARSPQHITQPQDTINPQNMYQRKPRTKKHRIQSE